MVELAIVVLEAHMVLVEKMRVEYLERNRKIGEKE
jgi:hypothetical protein